MFKTIKAWFSSKTINFALLLALVVGLQEQVSLFAPLLTPEGFRWFGFAVSMAIIALRSVTNTALLEKKP